MEESPYWPPKNIVSFVPPARPISTSGLYVNPTRGLIKSMWWHFNHWVWLSQEPGRHHRWDPIGLHPRQQRLQGHPIPPHHAGHCDMHRRGDFTNGGQLTIVGARLNYCNWILHGTTISNINKIHRVINKFNMLARLVTGKGKRDHITPVLEKLHWLPVQSRIPFKVAIITYETLLLKNGLSLGVAALPNCTKNTPIKFFKSSTR